VQTIRCIRCQHQWDTQYSKHCICPACRVSISVPDSRRNYLANGVKQPGAPVHVSGPLSTGHRAIAPKPGSAHDLPPPVRGEDGQPLPPPPPHVRKAGDPVADDFSFIARRAKQLAAETQERVAAGGPIEEGF
jgi:hypothetical protein